MNELKPEDVMRATECCATAPMYACNRRDCPYYYATSKYSECKHKLLSDVASLLREKDAEIERLTARQENVSFVLKSAMEHYDALYEEAKEILKTEARVEAIDEFAERLKKFYANLKGKTIGGSVEYHIDQIAKEMKGVTEKGG